jgi:hypothetical protein
VVLLLLVVVFFLLLRLVAARLILRGFRLRTAARHHRATSEHSNDDVMERLWTQDSQQPSKNLSAYSDGWMRRNKKPQLF